MFELGKGDLAVVEIDLGASRDLERLIILSRFEFRKFGLLFKKSLIRSI